MNAKVKPKRVEKLPPPTPGREALIQAYEKFAVRYNRLTDTTVAGYLSQLKPFFDWLYLEASPKQLNEMDFRNLQEFISVHGKPSMYSPMRSFLNFCYVMGYIDTDLKSAVPMIRRCALAGVPFILGDDDVETLLTSIDRDEPIGKRDYAMILLMLYYGIRGVQVRRMKLNDLFWQQSLIIIQAAKYGTAVTQPLLPAVGNAICDYIQCARSQSTDYQEVFLTCEGPLKPLASTGLTSMMIRRLGRAKVELPDYARKGTHLFRHRFASKMLDCGILLEDIADMLGHRDLNSTMIYTKIDFKKLIDIAQEWPGVIL